MNKHHSYKINLCGLNDCSPEWHWETDGFRDYDLWAVFRGSGILEVNGVHYEAKEGVCFLLPPNARICGRHNPKDPLLTANVHFHFLEDEKPVFPLTCQQRFLVNVSFFKELLERTISCFYRNQQKDAVAWLTVVLNEFFSCPQIQEKNTSPTFTLNVSKTYADKLMKIFPKQRLYPLSPLNTDILRPILERFFIN